MNPSEELEKGVELLNPLMEKYGYKFEFESSGSGSGGSFAKGSYINGKRKLSFSVMYSLGLVSYECGSLKMEHSEYLRALEVKGKYPGYSKKIIEAFEHLESDLIKYGATFLNGSEFELRKLFKFIELNPRKVGFSAL